MPKYGWSGYFHWYLIFQDRGSDAFGSRLFQLDRKLVGAETGRTYETDSFEGMLSGKGFKFQFKDGTYCNADYECRILQSKSMLLCRATVNDTNRGCVSGQVAGYGGFVKQP